MPPGFAHISLVRANGWYLVEVARSVLLALHSWPVKRVWVSARHHRRLHWLGGAARRLFDGVVRAPDFGSFEVGCSWPVCCCVVVMPQNGLCGVFWDGNVLHCLDSLDLFLVEKETSVNCVPPDLE